MNLSIKKIPFWILGSLLGLSFADGARASVPFNYSTRIRDYSGWSSTIRGDINTVGMGGANVAIPSSISSSADNPAGFAMVLSSFAVQINSNTIKDEHVQKSGETFESNQWGVGISPSSWGLGITYYSPATESGLYVSPSTGHELITEVSVKEVKLVGAIAFFENRLSLGVGIGIARGVRQLGHYSFDGTCLDVQGGALWRLPGHLLIGLSGKPAQIIHSPVDGGSGQTEMPGFNRAILMPSEVAMGVGWIPNRFFKAGFELHYAGTTNNTALLANQDQTVGNFATLQPRIGASYVLAEYNHLKIEYALGSYYEISRIQNETSRFHGTMGLEVNPWFVNTGLGFDFASGYKNVMFTVGIDLVRTLRTLEIIPKDPVPFHNDYLPPPMILSGEGLPDGFTTGEEKKAGPPSLGDIGDIILMIPQKIREKNGQ